MKKILLFSALLLSLNTVKAKIEPVEEWSFNSAFNVGLSTTIAAALPGYIAYQCCGGFGDGKDLAPKAIVSISAAVGGLIGYTIGYYHTPEERFNQALAILQNEQNEQWFSLFEEAQTASAIWAMVDSGFFETKYPRVFGMMRIKGLYNSLVSCMSMLEKAVATESNRFYPNDYIIKHGKQMIEQAHGHLVNVKRWIIELRNDQAYLMQNNAYASEMAAAAARQAAFNSSIAAMNSGHHYHYHRHW